MKNEIIKTKVDLLAPDKVDAAGEFIDFILRKSQEENTKEQLIKLQAESGPGFFNK